MQKVMILMYTVEKERFTTLLKNFDLKYGVSRRKYFSCTATAVCKAVSNELEEEDTVNMITYIFAFFMHSVSIFVTLETN